MKTFVVASALAALMASTNVHAMQSYLKQLPNGDKFTKQLGHTDTGYTAFGTAFENADTTWSTDFCKQTFPGSKITNGQAFGDPCCTWKVGEPAPQSVTAFTTDPGAGTTCASASSPSSAPSASSSGSSTSPSSAPSASSSGSSTSSTTPAPPSSAGSSDSSSTGSAATPAPAASTTTTPSSGSTTKKTSDKKTEKKHKKDKKEKKDKKDKKDSKCKSKRMRL